MATHMVRSYSVSLLLFLALPALHLFADDAAEKRAKMDRHGDPLPPQARLRIGTTRLRHGGEIVALAFSPDGRSIATVGRDATLSLWDRSSGKGLVSFETPGGVAVAFADGGKSLLWCDARGQIYRCDAGQRGDDRDGRRQRLHKFDLDSSERIDVVVFTEDGSAAAAGTSANRVYFWGRRIELKLRDGIQAVALDRGGQRLAVNNGHEGIRIQDVSSQRQGRGAIRTFGGNAVRSLAFSPDGRFLAAGDFENRIRLWDANSNREVHMLEGHRRVPVSGKNGVFCLAFSSDGSRLASGAADGVVRIWEVKSGKELAHCAGHGGRVQTLAFAPDGKTLASAGADNALRLWNADSGAASGPVPDEGGAVSAMSLSAEGRTLAVVQMPGKLSLWDVTAGKELPKTPKLPAPVAAAVFTPMGRTLVSASVAGHLHFWDCDKGHEQHEMRNVQASIRLLAAANRGAIVAWCGNDRRVVLWDAKAGKEIRQFRPQGNTISELLFSPDGETLLVAGSAGVSMADGRRPPAGSDRIGQMTPAVRLGSVLAAALSPDGRVLATGGQDGAVRLWELASGKQRRAMYGDTAFVRAAAFSPDGKVLATGSSNGLLRLWDVTTGQRLHVYAGHRGSVVAAAFAERGSTLLTASVDGTVLVWDLPALLEAGRSKLLELSPRQMQALWRDLASDDAPRAYEAVEALARAPAQTVPFLRERIVPVSAEKLAQRIKELDSDQYSTRLRAMNELSEMGKYAEPALRKLLAEKPSLEARRRAQELLARLDSPSTMTEHLRALRAVEVLERIGTEPARTTLRKLAEGAAEAQLTREAKAVLRRLSAEPRP